MPRTWYDCMHLRQRPRWDVDGGLWYPTQGTGRLVAEDKVNDLPPQRMYRHKPSIPTICEPLMGSSLRNAEGRIIGVRYPPLERRLLIYREGIELVYVFREYDDLISLAAYRRQVTRRGGIPMDLLFFNLACDARFPKEKWAQLAERMPDRAPIRDACLRRATLGPDLLAAAE